MSTFRVLAAVLLISHICPAAQTFEDAVRELAAKLPSRAQRLASLLMRSNLDLAAAARVQEVLESELGVKFVEPGAESEMRVTISENLRDYLLIVEMGQGAERRIWMSQWPRPLVRNSTHHPALTLERKLLWEQDAAILDVALRGDLLLVLEAGRLAVYERREARWQAQQSVPIPQSSPRPRDARGRVIIDGEALQVFLPGVACQGVMAQQEAKLQCSQSNEPWPLSPRSGVLGEARLAPGRNFFERPPFPPFFSMALLEDRSESLWLISGLDGRTLVFDGSGKQRGVITGWGSEIAAIETACRGRQVLATGPGDGSDSDSVQAFELIGEEARATSSALEFPGTVTALWPQGSGAAAVVRDNGSGRYAAYSLEIRCTG